MGGVSEHRLCVWLCVEPYMYMYIHKHMPLRIPLLKFIMCNN